MKNAYGKNVVRLVTRNFRRFSEILLIVALGVAFFAGVRAASPDMKLTVEKYFDDANAGDIRLISTLGITDEDVNQVAALEGVQSVSAEYSVKGTVSVNHESMSLSFESVDMARLTEKGTINRPELTEGTCPAKQGECLADRQLMKKAGLKIGDVITIVDKEDNAAAENLKVHEYTITGFVRSTKYIALSRTDVPGSSDDVMGYLFVDRGDFDMDVATALYVKTENPDNFGRSAKEYEAYLTPIAERIEQLGTVRAPLRYDEVMTEANKELDDAKKQVADGEKELADAEKELSDGQAELDDARFTLDQSEASYKSQIASARGQLNDAKKQLDESYLTLTSSNRGYESGVQGYHEGEEQAAQLTEGIAQCEQGILQIEQAITANEQMMASLDPTSDQYQKLFAANEALAHEKAIQQATLAELQKNHAAAREKLDATKALLEESKAKLDEGWAAYYSGYDTYTASVQAFETQKESGRRQIEEARSTLAEKQRELDEAKAEFEEKKPEALADIADGEKQIADGEKELEKISSPKWYVTPLPEDTGFSGYLDDSDRIAAIGLVFPLLFFLVAALVTLTNMTRMVESDRTEIGVLKALGYSGFKISFKYLCFIILSSVIGTFIGLVAGLLILPKVIFDAYGILYDLPSVLTPISLENSILGGGLALLCAVAPTIAVCKAELVSSPASLMRPRSPKMGKRIFLEYITPFWKRLSFSKKVAARNIFRYKQRLFMSVIGIAGCTALIMTGFGIRDCISSMVPVQYGELQHYDMMAYFHEDFTDEQRRAFEEKTGEISNISHIMFTSQQDVDLQKGDTSSHNIQSAVLIVPEDMDAFSDFITLRTRLSKKDIKISDEGVVLTEKLASKLKVKKDGIVNIRTKDGEEHPVKVLGVCENYVYHYVHMTPGLYENLYGGSAEINAAYGALADSDESAQKEIADQVESLQGVSAVSFSSNVQDTFTKMTAALDFVVVVLIVSAAALAFVVLFSLTNINIDERVRELATLKVLGFTDFETSMHIYRENVVITAMGVLLGLGMGVALTFYVLSTVEMDMVMFTRTILGRTYVISAAFTVLFAFIVNIIMKRTIKNIDMVESLKSVE